MIAITVSLYNFMEDEDFMVIHAIWGMGLVREGISST